MIVAVVEAHLDLLKLLKALRTLHVVELLLVLEALHCRQLVLGRRRHLLALATWLAAPSTATFLALKETAGIHVTQLVWDTGKVSLGLRVRVHVAEGRMLLQELLNLRRVLLLDQELLQVVIVQLHLRVLASSVETAVLDKVVGQGCGLKLAGARRVAQRCRVLGHATGLLCLVLLYLLDLFLC